MADSYMLDSEKSSPLYRQLLVTLRAEIMNGTYPVHSKIPSEQELCDSYHVSRVTVRTALAGLVEEGMLERYQGKGTFVCMPRLHKDLRAVNSFSDICRAMGVQAGTRLVSAGMLPAEGQDVHALLCPAGSQVVEIIRLRTADEEPVMLEINHFPAQYEWLLQEDMSLSLYELLRMHRVDTGKASHEISLCYADSRDAELLAVEPGTALLCLKEVIYDHEGQPLHTSLQHIRGDRFTFQI